MASPAVAVVASRASRTPPNTPARVAQQASGLCYKHFRFGDQAHGCVKPCNWQGN